MYPSNTVVHAAAFVPAFVGLAAIGTASAQRDWQNDLTAEILIMEDCEVSFLTQVIDRQMDGRALVMAKVHCIDGRTFDALREDAFAAFTFTICEPEEEPASC